MYITPTNSVWQDGRLQSFPGLSHALPVLIACSTQKMALKRSKTGDGNGAILTRSRYEFDQLDPVLASSPPPPPPPPPPTMHWFSFINPVLAAFTLMS